MLRTLMSVALIAVATPAPAHSHTLQSDLDAIVAQGTTSALLEVRDGRHTLRLTSGTAVRGTTTPVDPAGRFRAGSVTKMLVGTVVLQLVAEHRLGLDDRVDRWLPGLLPTGNGITVRQLLDHTNGLYDVTRTLPLNPPSAFLPYRWKTWTTRHLIARATAYAPTFPPGDGYTYTSTGYLVLGLLIERITGHPYGQETTRRLHLPRTTRFPGTDPHLHGPHAHAYLPDGTDITEMNPSVMGAAGSLISTAADLNDFVTALLAGRYLPPSVLDRMKTVQAPSTRGLGLEVIPLPCGTAYGHRGDALGVSAWTFATGPRQAVTLSVTWGTARPSRESVDRLLEHALCRR
ncbi:serine hydrolase domain-containing protein [Actinoplanes solisilvae]|uniref:serine hydrolase domain-containing protein n=1 Tax=Actinoplanes solisilvae TaxID=2486853 RepID=UPI000FDB5230|nr:serine hydrolase domain-containing protein [Actinoplanes solisilvae]